MHFTRSVPPLYAFRHKFSHTIQSWTLERAPFRLLPGSTYTYWLYSVDRMSGLGTKFTLNRTIRHVPSHWPVIMGHLPLLHEAMHRTGLPRSTSKSAPSNRRTKAASYLLGVLHTRSLQLRNPRPPICDCG